MGEGLLVHVSLIEGVVIACCEKTPYQHLPRVELLGQTLDDKSRLGPLVVALPESGRSSSVDFVVAMMEGYDPESTCTKYTASQYSLTAPYQQIKVESLYLLDVLVRKPIDIARP